MTIRDVVIVGGGPAGLTAGLYASRARLDALLLERMAPGGQIAVTELVENYPGFPDGIEGAELAAAMERQAVKFGLTIEYGEVSGLRLDGGVKVLDTSIGEVRARTVILATGTQPKMTAVPGEGRLFGRGVSTCATCDGPLYRGRVVGVVGGGDSAVQEALFLTKFADKCYVFHRRDALRAVQVLQDRATADPKIEFVWNAQVLEVVGKDAVEGLRWRDKVSGAEEVKAVDGVFVFIGLIPRSEVAGDLVDRDEAGFIRTDAVMETRTPGLYAVGDVRVKTLRQVATAVADGAIAAFDLEKHLV
jgi:thioredoxin reductase (NADPH)